MKRGIKSFVENSTTSFSQALVYSGPFLNEEIDRCYLIVRLHLPRCYTYETIRVGTEFDGEIEVCLCFC